MEMIDNKDKICFMAHVRLFKTRRFKVPVSFEMFSDERTCWVTMCQFDFFSENHRALGGS